MGAFRYKHAFLCLAVGRTLLQRGLHTSRALWSLADRIKAFLPSLGLVDEMQPTLPEDFKAMAMRKLKEHNANSAEPHAGLPSVTSAGQEPPISGNRRGLKPPSVAHQNAIKQMLADPLRFEEGVAMVIARSSIDESISIFEQCVLHPVKHNRDKWGFWLLNLCYSLISQGNEPLAIQLLMNGETDCALASVAQLKLVQTLDKVQLSDQLFVTLSRHYLDSHFPQALWSKHVNQWTRARLLQAFCCHCKDKSRTKVYLERGLRTLNSRECVYLLLHESDDEFWKSTLRAVLENTKIASDPPPNPEVLREQLSGLVMTIDTRPKLKAIVKQVKIISPELAEALLRTALKLRMTMETAKIASHFSNSLSTKSLGRALVFILRAQPGLMEGHTDRHTLVNDPQYDLVTKILASLPHTEKERVIEFAISSLQRRSSKQGMSSRALWALLLSVNVLDLQGSEKLHRQLAALVVERPIIEQLRYMALSGTSAHGVVYLLRKNIQAMKAARKDSEQENVNSLHDQAEVSFILASILIVGEKSVRQTGLASQSFGQAVLNLFADWSPDSAEALLENIQHYGMPNPSALVVALEMLIKEKCFGLTFQVLNQTDLSIVPPHMLYKYLLGIAAHNALIFPRFLDWFVDKNIFIQPSVLRETILVICGCEYLNAHQVMHRTNKLINILRGLGQKPGPKASAALVDRLLLEADKTRAGSLLRLKWALTLAEENCVDSITATMWRDQIDAMKEEKRGFWAELGRNTPA